jgi:hypothetical protein
MSTGRRARRTPFVETNDAGHFELFECPQDVLLGAASHRGKFGEERGSFLTVSWRKRRAASSGSADFPSTDGVAPEGTQFQFVSLRECN